MSLSRLRTFIELHDEQVLAAGLAHTGHGDAETHPGNGVQRFRLRTKKVYRQEDP